MMAGEVGTFQFRLEGLRELNEALESLGKVTARRVGRRALQRAGQDIADRASQLAPDDPATDGDDLRRSIIVSTKLKDRRGLSEFAKQMAATGNRFAAATALREVRRATGPDTVVSLAIGPAGLPARYGHLQEFGTVHHAAQPFLTPAWEAEKAKAMQAIAGHLKTEIEKAAQRAARRAAKRAGAA